MENKKCEKYRQLQRKTNRNLLMIRKKKQFFLGYDSIRTHREKNIIKITAHKVNVNKNENVFFFFAISTQ